MMCREAIVRLGVGLVLASTASLASAQASPIELEVATSVDDVVVAEQNGFDLVTLSVARASMIGEPGTPWLPARCVHVLLPSGMQVGKLAAKVVEQEVLPGTYHVHPAQPPVPLSEPAPYRFTEAEPTAYGAASSVAPVAAELVDVVVIRGYRVAVVRLFPVDYVPATGTLSVRTRIALTLSLKSAPQEAGAEVMTYKRPEPIFEAFVRDDVINPEALATNGYAEADPLSPADPDDVRWLLIGDPSMFDEFQPLLDWKTRKGVPAAAIDVNWIYANYTGYDLQEKIKACIKDYVQNKGTVYVVLAGDNTIVPDRDCYGAVGSSTDPTIPTDLYYAGLDDMDWDDSGDGLAGVPWQDSIDMGPDVFVGRFPVRSEADATAMVNKTLAYEKDLPASGFATKMMLAGVTLWQYADAEGKSENMFYGWIAPYWSHARDRLYDTNTEWGPSYNVTVDHINERLAAGYNLFHMATHGLQYLWSMETGGSYGAGSAMAAINPGKYANILTIACITNAFEDSYTGYDPCLSEGFMRNPNGGAVTYIGGSRYGWGYAGTYDHGPSFCYDRMFYEFLLTGEPTDHPQEVGPLYAKMKEFWIGSSGTLNAFRWCQFSINLMGDPELCLYVTDPQVFAPTLPSHLPTGPQTLTIQTGVPGARVCVMQGTSIYTYGQANGAGGFSTSIDPQDGVLLVTMTAPNYDPYETTITVGQGSDAVPGTIAIAENLAACNDTLHVILDDADLVGAGTQDITLATSAGDWELFTLSEIGATGVFEGTVVLTADSPASGNSTLEVQHLDTITATYQDADNGSGFPSNVADSVSAQCGSGPFETLQNGDFEGGFVGHWGGDMPNDWSETWRPPFVDGPVWDDYNVGGDHGHVMRFNNIHGDFEIGVRQQVTGLTPGEPFVFSAEAFQVGAGTTAWLAVDPEGGTDLPVRSDAFGTGVGAWMTASVAGHVGTTGTVTVFLWAWNQGGMADVYVDNASLMVGGDEAIERPLIAAAVSERDHGATGTFAVSAAAMGGGMTVVEPRVGGPQRLVVTFDQAIVGVDGLDVSDVVLSHGTVDQVSITGSTLTVDVQDAVGPGLLAVWFPGIASTAGSTSGQMLCLGLLPGDVSGDDVVNIFDLLDVRNALGAAVDAATFTRDVTADGDIDIFDLLTARNNLGQTVTSCP